MLNIIEVFGFSLAVLEIYFPHKAVVLEKWIDYKIRNPIALPLFKDAHKEAIFTCSIIGIFIGILVILIYRAELSELPHNFVQISFMVVVGAAAISPVLFYIFQLIVYVLSYILKKLITFSNFIHPSGNAIAGAGFMIGFIGIISKLTLIWF